MPAPTTAGPPAETGRIHGAIGAIGDYLSRLSAWEREQSAAARERGGVTGHIDAFFHDLGGSVADVFSNTFTFSPYAP